MAGVKIPDLTIYGSQDLAKSGKDLFEVAKNTGTFAAPVYSVNDSRRITLDELKSSLNVAVGRSVTVIQVLQTSTNPDVYDLTIVPADNNKYFRLESLTRWNTHNQFGTDLIYFNLILPVNPVNGFQIVVNFDTDRHNTNSFDNFTFSSGFTYMITWSETDSKWLYDRQKNITDFRNGAILNLTDLNAFQAGQDYYIHTSFPDNDVITNTMAIVLPKLNISVGETVSFTLLADVGTGTEFLSFNVQAGDAILEANTPQNTPTRFVPPYGCKSGSYWKFLAFHDTITSFSPSASNILKYWKLIEERIIL